ncbi:hypothetical protein OUZ56_012993 [Daphnia magna]|uniref:Secreted protein n=1 Tax=Daphnia magna TaxID=35525 RepID=A0ABQ9Z4M6_9CRUS|nr:hypothetical protein OUZ56_012993 [Daphnia magna]
MLSHCLLTSAATNCAYHSTPDRPKSTCWRRSVGKPGKSKTVPSSTSKPAVRRMQEQLNEGTKDFRRDIWACRG